MAQLSTTASFKLLHFTGVHAGSRTGAQMLIPSARTTKRTSMLVCIIVPTRHHRALQTDGIEYVELHPQDVNNSCGGAPSCPFYIAVSPYVTGVSTYDIVVANATTVIALNDGRPETGYVHTNEVNHYSFTVLPQSSFHSLTISLSAFMGDPDMYVTLNDNSGVYPSPYHYDYSATAAGGDDFIYISFSDPIYTAKCPPNSQCVMSISVVGADEAFYSITATTSGGVTQLINGLAVTGYVAQGSYAYFNFTPPVMGNLSIFVTALSGDPDVYVSAAVVNQFPTRYFGNYTWSAITGDDEVVVITTADPAYPQVFSAFAIGVYGWGGNTSFTVVARMERPGAATRLIDGMPQAGYSLPHSMSYYLFNMSKTYPLGRPFPGLDIAAMPEQGDVDLYVSNITTPNPDGSTSFVFPKVICTWVLSTGACALYGVDRTTYTWSSTMTGVQDLIAIPPSQLYLGEGLVIGVLATSPDGPNGVAPKPSVFSVIAATGATTMTLQTGVQFPGVVRASQYKYYRYSLSAWGMDIVVNTAVLTGGSLDIFVAENFIPSNGNSTWNTTSKSGGILKDKYVVVPFTSLSPRCQSAMFNGEPCNLMIAVQGFWNMPASTECGYTIAASISGSPVYPFYLSDSQSVPAAIPAHLNEYFYSIINIPSDRTIFVTTQNLYGSVTMYVNIGTGKGFYIPGSSSSPDIISPDTGGFERLVIPPPPWNTQAQQKQQHVSSVSAALHIDVDKATGTVAVTSTVDGNGRVLVGKEGARVVATMPSGAAVIEIPLAALGIKDAVGSASYSEAATRHMKVNKYGTGEQRATMEKVHEAEAAIRAEGSSNTKPTTASDFAAAGTRVMVSDAKGNLHSNIVAPLFDEERVSIPINNNTLWCTGCEMYITLTSSVDSFVVVSYVGGNTYSVLQDDSPLEGFSPANAYGYYAFSAVDPTQDVTISINQAFGEVDAYIIVQQPSSPQQMPTSFWSTWVFRPWMGQSSITLNHTDPLFCHPQDGSPAGAPCTFLIGVFARRNETASYTITASADASPLLPLFDGVPVSGQVVEGAMQYYSFQPVAPGYNVPPVVLSWSNLLGSVTAYVTNQFVPGVSAPNQLPGPNSAVACQWVATNYSTLFLWPGDPCYLKNGGAYTIGIAGNTGYPGYVSEYQLTAVVAGDTTRLVYGVPTTNIFLPNFLNINFTFTIDDNTRDIVIAATPTYGNLALMVAHDNGNSTGNSSDAGSVPNCVLPCGGCQLKCTGYTWLMPSFGASPILYLPAANPCSPVTPEGNLPAIVSPSCDPTYSFRRGRYYAVLYGMAPMTETSLYVTSTGRQPLTLPDGQPQDVQTGPVVLCGSRDNTTGMCTGIGGRIYNVQMSNFAIRIPYSGSAGSFYQDNYVIIDRLCGNTTGYCGPSLHVYVVACPASGPNACDGNAPYPYSNNAAVVSDVVVSDVQNAVRVSYSMCVGGTPGADCLIYVAAYPICEGNTPTQPGVNCDSTMFRATLSTDTGIERISEDCLMNGRTCVMPEVTSTTGMTKRYQAYIGDDGSTVQLNLNAQVCSGTVNVYYCDAFSGHCNPVNQPGPANYDATTAPDPHGNAVMTPTISSGMFFLGVRASSTAGTTSPSYQLMLTAGNGPQLILPQNAPQVNAYRDNTLTALFVYWTSVMISIPGIPPYGTTGATYAVYAFPLNSIGQARADTPCGVDDANAMNIAGAVKGFTRGTEITLYGLNPTSTYTVSVVATCPAGSCMPNNQMEQRVAFYPATSNPTPASPSPSPAPQPGPNNPSNSGMSTGAAAGIAVAALLAVGVGGFFGYRRFTGASVSLVPDSIGAFLPSWLGGSSSTGSYGGGRYGYLPNTDSGVGMFTSGGADDGNYMPVQLPGAESESTYTAL